MAALRNMPSLAIKSMAASAFALLTVPSFQYSHSAFLRANDPKAAHAAKPDDAMAAAAYFADKFEQDPEFQLNSDDVGQMRRALLGRPLEPTLLALLGMHHEIRNEPQRAAALMQLANRISRRSAVSGLWLIEQATASEDTRTALRHYNSVLSVRLELHGTLLPILASAISFPEVRAELRPYLEKPARWSGAFIALAATQSSASDLQALLHPMPRGLLDEANSPILADIFHRLAVELGKDSATGFARSLVPDFKPETLSSLAVSPETMDKRLGRMAWNFPAVDGIAVETDADQSLRVTSQPFSRGEATVRDLFLEAGGRYVLTQRVAFGSEASKPVVKWVTSCVAKEGQVQFWEQRIPASDSSSTYRASLNIPAACSVVRFSLQILGPDGQSPTSVAFDQLSLVKQ